MLKMLLSSNKYIVIFAIVAWLIVAALYLIHTPYGERAHDFGGHLEYTSIIANDHRLPMPHEGHETFHPPLYYFINSFIVPVHMDASKRVLLKNEESYLGLEKHIGCVQALSVLYGAGALWIIAWFLRKVTQNTIAQLLTLLFIATTPKYVFVFSTYNNDSLATLLCLAIIAISYKLYLNWPWVFAFLLLGITTTGVYTKTTTFFCILVICIICCKNFFKGKPPVTNQIRIMAILILSTTLLFPWMVFHNYKHTKTPISTNFTFMINRNLNLKEIKKSLRLVIENPFPGHFSQKWYVPWAYGYEYDSSATKQHDYLAFTFVTSILGEFKFNTPHVNFIWIILWIHLLAYLSGLIQTFRSAITKLSTCFIFFTHFINFTLIALLRVPMAGSLLDYRYIYWSIAGWAILYASALSNKSIWSWLLRTIIIIGIIIQVYILMTVTGT